MRNMCWLGRRIWVQNGFQKAFWLDLWSILGRFGEHLAKDLRGLEEIRMFQAGARLEYISME